MFCLAKKKTSEYISLSIFTELRGKGVLQYELIFENIAHIFIFVFFFCESTILLPMKIFGRKNFIVSNLKISVFLSKEKNQSHYPFIFEREENVEERSRFQIRSHFYSCELFFFIKVKMYCKQNLKKKRLASGLMREQSETI